MKIMRRAIVVTLMLALLSPAAWAYTKAEIDAGVRSTLKLFNKKVPGGAELLKKSKGALIFPEIVKGGIGIGGEYGEGVLQIGGRTVDYYSSAAVSVGFQLGVQTKSMVVLFLKSKELKAFRGSKGWKAGVDGSVAVVEWGAGKDVSTLDSEKPIVAFIFNNQGLMYNLTIEGSKFTKIKR
ncbi:MAG: YSC84-related protein [Gammaproteobacteria bacterium]|nr:YSC84-related protein [Gammaproteobacteria bacterium]MCW8983671.1 YSC84-related protein [Gammaproteobacteria bacterium]